MKVLIALCVLVACAWADVHENVPIVMSEMKSDNEGNFHYKYESADGSTATQDGHLKHIDDKHDGEVTVGSYSYVGDDGKNYNVTYSADETGFHPHGDHIPVAPPIPEAIVRALKLLPNTQA